ncbi:MAG: ABC-F family ATP-binding cassette domain-containing protein [Pseudomonadota bacterium]
MASLLLSLSGICLSFGGQPLLENAALTVSARRRIALVGRNGSGKSTLLKIAAGLVEPDAGDVFVDPAARVGYLDQEPDLSGYDTLGAYVAAGAPAFGDPSAGRRYMDALSLSPEAAPAALSGGEARRAALARLLVGEFDVLLLDEPTNHLDLDAIAWLEGQIGASAQAVVVVSHDRAFLEATTNETVWIDRGAVRVSGKGFAHFEEWRDALLEQEQAASHKLDRKIAAEEDWVRYGVTARRKRNVRRMGALEDLRRTRREARKATGSVTFSVNVAASAGKRVIVAEGLSKRWGERTVVDNFSIEIARGDRVAFVGPNGAGKTTLLRLLTGDLEPDAGTVALGTNSHVLTLDQRRAGLNDAMRVADAITDGRGDYVTIGGTKKHAATYLQEFLFAPEQWRSPVGALSGGERGRLALAAALAKPSNLLVLDEPTNDLDLETLELLEERLSDYPGTILLVSHDRRFLDRLATSVVAPAPDGPPGRWLDYVGGYEDMIAQGGRPPGRGPSPAKPKKAGARPAAATRTAQSKASGKLSYKDQYALERLPGAIDALDGAIAAAKAALSDPTLFAKDAARFAALAADLEAKEAERAALEEQWLELEIKREALEG